MINIQKIKFFFLFIVSFALPFNSLPLKFSKLGHLSSAGAFYPLFMLVAMYCLQIIRRIITRKQIVIKNNLLVGFVTIFLTYILFVLIYNLDNISQNEHMGVLGLTRFYVSYRLLLFGFLVMFAIASTVISIEHFQRIVRIISIVMTLFILFAIFQFIAYEYKGIFLDIYRIIGSYIYPEGLLEWALERRHALHSVTQEPSFLAMYLSVMTPFIITHSIKHKRYVLLSLITIVIIMSKSRTAYVIYTFELFLFFYFLKYYLIKLKYLLSASLLLAIFILIIFMTPLSTVFLSLIDMENSSNAARYAAAYSSLMVWWNNNILFGVGLGQTGFYSIQHLPDWGYLTGDIVDTINGERWPPIHNLLVRLLVETGLIGIMLFFAIYMYLIYQTYRIVSFKYRKNFEADLLGYAVIISLIASFLIMFNQELLFNFNIWVTWGLGLAYITMSKNEVQNITKC